MSAERRMVVALLDNFTLFLSEAGTPLSAEQQAVVDNAKNTALQQVTA